MIAIYIYIPCRSVLGDMDNGSVLVEDTTGATLFHYKEDARYEKIIIMNKE